MKPLTVTETVLVPERVIPAVVQKELQLPYGECTSRTNARLNVEKSGSWGNDKAVRVSFGVGDPGREGYFAYSQSITADDAEELSQFFAELARALR